MASIYRILKQEHKEVIRGIKEIQRKKSDNFEEIYHMLMMHMDGEEEQVYPVFREFPKLKDMVVEALEEHKHARMINDELKNMSVEDEEFLPRLKVLKEMLEHHIDQEENQVFPQAKKIVGDEMDKDMAQSYMDFKEMAM